MCSKVYEEAALRQQRQQEACTARRASALWVHGRPSQSHGAGVRSWSMHDKG